MANRKNKREAKLILNMIVRDEAHVIERCLENVGHLLDAIAIVDTGSRDQTIELIEEWAKKKNLPCRILRDPWRDDFGYSRTVALDHSQEVVKEIQKEGETWYRLFMDADNLAFAEDGVSPITVNKQRLEADAYEIAMRQGKSQYGYIWLVRVDPQRSWRWYGPRHEYISEVKDEQGRTTWQAKFARLEGGYIESRREGSRSNDPNKYLRDALVFEKALLEEPMNDRYLYYMAQSYRDAARGVLDQANHEKEIIQESKGEEKKRAELKYQQLSQQAALLWQRAEKGFVFRASVPPFHLWNDEYTYHAWLEAARIRRYRKGKYDNVYLEYLAKAHEKRPHRLEAAYYLLNYYLSIGAHRLGWSLAQDLVKLPYPKDEHIFVDEAIHQYMFIFEASLCAYYSGAKDEFVTLTKRVLRHPNLPENIRLAAKSNLDKFGK